LSTFFSDTIIVDNIDVARRLGIGNAKYVTLDGDAAEKSGAMRGGYRFKRKQSMGFKEEDIANEIEKYEGLINDLKNTIEVLEKTRIENEDLIANLRIKKAGLEGEIIKIEKSLHLEATDLEASEQKKSSLVELQKEIDKKINLVQDKTNVLNNELITIKTERQKLRDAITQLSNPTLIAELNAFEEKLKELDESIIRIDSEIKNIDIQTEGKRNFIIIYRRRLYFKQRFSE